MLIKKEELHIKVDIEHVIVVHGLGVKKFAINSSAISVTEIIDCESYEGMSISGAIEDFLSNEYSKFSPKFIDYLSKVEYSEKYADIYERPFATEDDFIKNLDVVIDVWERFKIIFTNNLKHTGGFCNPDSVNNLIKKAKKEAKTKQENEIAVEGFFDSFAALIFEHKFSIDKAYITMDKEIEKLKIKKNLQ